ncbi:MAG: septal ring lytic transglycosylase RlpA family protein [Vulcanococcus sp.]
MRRFVLLGGSALLLSGSSALTPAFATTGRVAAPESAPSIELAIRNVEASPSTEELPLKKPAAPVLPIATPSDAPSPERNVRSVSRGQASWYGPGFYGNRTASGEVLRRGSLTAAHRHLPFGTKVRVTNLHNGRSAVVRINDRGPFHGHRVIDLAHGAASELGVVASGTANVKLEVLQ